MNIKMNYTKEKLLSIWSNIFFIPPFIFSFINKDVSLFLLLIGVLFFSTMYHIVKSPGIDWWWHTGRTPLHSILLFADTLFATGTFVYVVFKTYQNPFTPMIWFSVFIFIIAFILYMFPRKNEIYEITHSTWHFLVGMALTLLGISVYISNLI